MYTQTEGFFLFFFQRVYSWCWNCLSTFPASDSLEHKPFERAKGASETSSVEFVLIHYWKKSTLFLVTPCQLIFRKANFQFLSRHKHFFAYFFWHFWIFHAVLTSFQILANAPPQMLMFYVFQIMHILSLLFLHPAVGAAKHDTMQPSILGSSRPFVA